MGKTITVAKPIAVADFATIDTGVTTIQVILDASSITIAESETKSLIGVSTNRAAEIITVKEKIVDKHASSLPDGTTSAGFAADQVYISSLKKSHTGLVDQAAKLGVMILVSENNLYVKMSNIMKHVKLLGETDKVLGETDKVLADLHKEIADKYHPHSSHTSGVTNFKINPTVVVTQSVVSGKTFTNKAKAVLSILVVAGNVNDTILVNPFSGVILPEAWNNIVVTNLSTTEEGSFDIFIK